MYTKAMIEEMFQNDVAATREWRKQYKADYEQIEKTFNETRDLGPKKTVEILIDRLGHDRARAVVATMINSIGSWDGRIDDRNRAWAKTIDEAFDKEAAQDAFIYCSIHSCHAEQIASEMRRAERPVEPVEAEEDEQTETVSEDATDATETAEQTEDEAFETSKIDRDLVKEYIDGLCDPDSLGVHDYVEEMKTDIAQYIADEAEIEDGEDRDDFEQRLNDDLWTEDSVTGNGSGSYTFSGSKAHENVMGNEDYVRQMVYEWGIEAKDLVDRFLNAEWEWFDVSIRCYLLGQVLAEVIDDLIETGAIRFAA